MDLDKVYSLSLYRSKSSFPLDRVVHFTIYAKSVYALTHKKFLIINWGNYFVFCNMCG